MVEDEMSPKVHISEEQRRKISEGMKRAHRRRKAQASQVTEQKKAPVTNGRGVGLLGRLKLMRSELDAMIKALEGL